ncbi:autotransporter assembly complex family protein [Dongia sp.]|uniref:autotransporter assembly complex protein TamA n=1 Tax=Dongia sp. TaxID=1977262 RepID=UPI003751ADE8
MTKGRRIADVLLALLLASVPPGAAAAAEPKIEQAGYKVEMTTVEDATLGAALHSSSTLIELEEKPPEDVTALRRRAIEDLARLKKALRSAGYYDGNVTITVDGETVVPGATPGDYEDASKKKIPVAIRIEPGPLYKLRKIEVTGYQGLQLRLKPGTAARASMIIAERRLLLDKVMAEGHPFAAVALKPATVDHATHELDVSFEVTPGPVADLGKVTVKGLDYTNPDFVAKRAVFPPDTKYSPAALEGLRSDLQSLDLFSAVKVIPAAELDADGTLPVSVEVTERERHFVGFGASYSTNDGAGATAYWGTRNLFGNGERLRFDATVDGADPGEITDKLDYRLSSTFRKPDFMTLRQDLVASLVAADEHDPDSFDKRAATLNVGFERALSKTVRVNYGWETEAAHIKDDTGTNDFFLNGPTASIAYDTSDDLLNPTRGVRLTFGGEALPTWLGSSEDVYTLNGTAAGYLNLLGKGDLVLAGRLGVASAFGSRLEDLPADRRLYAGGGGSVRGYEFRSISPESSDGDEIGGRSSITGSIELRYRFLEDFGIVPFFDAGTVSSDSTPNFDEPIQYAAGVGFRYYTSFGPIRADIAVPLNPRHDDDPVAFYVSIGQAF